MEAQLFVDVYPVLTIYPDKVQSMGVQPGIQEAVTQDNLLQIQWDSNPKGQVTTETDFQTTIVIPSLALEILVNLLHVAPTLNVQL